MTTTTGEVFHCLNLVFILAIQVGGKLFSFVLFAFNILFVSFQISSSIRSRTLPIVCTTCGEAFVMRDFEVIILYLYLISLFRHLIMRFASSPFAANLFLNFH